MDPVLIIPLLLIVVALVIVLRTVRIVPQQTAQIIERLGGYNKTLTAGIHFLIPFVDKVRANIDLREQVVTFPPQPVITSDNLVVNIDTVIYYSVTDAKAAVYEIANFIQGIEQLTVTTLRNVIGSLDLEQALTSRDQINGQLRGVLDEATGKWGIRVNRVELKAIDPPHSVQETMEKQMRAERDRRAAILTAEGFKQSAILTAEGEKQSQILRAEGSAQARILEAQGQARAIQQVFAAIHRGKPTQKLLAYQYLQVLPQLARGDSNKMWIIPSELTDALKGIGTALGGQEQAPSGDDEQWLDTGDDHDNAFAETVLEDPAKALAEARGQAAQASAESTEHAAPVGRAQPVRGGAADVAPASPMTTVDPSRLARSGSSAPPVSPGAGDGGMVPDDAPVVDLPENPTADGQGQRG
ncbi:SPFH domain-containing protein [Terracoccus luteus]|uniref:Regulator of protease activity HflC (Stomatin/prohibitin superfamily) n=1 Tax=Terracoccus luteus TaxID=53356 RepID=A0A495Y253_9MICO|nr:SPFH domain-containing protein [Terracoccus luteus]MBB2987690.1 regulator of protease activity HflC (stomatin/prohibitin superfamily) [Terracoccus luteus]MCP2173341.1 regulator of protease activity HflC (stomatin/prohibitin superfamily) [Terracoccus luteus]RKT78078.1 SPFH domain-containing protein [Terracoccus luteus]